MEFWGVEVKIGETLKVSPGDGMILHLSQACIGEIKNERLHEAVYLFVNINGKKLVLGTLFANTLPQQQFDLVFDGDFELSHNFKNASVYFYGYKGSNPFEDGSEGVSDEYEEEDNPLTTDNNGIPESKRKQEKPVEAAEANADKGKESNAGKQKMKIVEPKNDADSDDDNESSDEDNDEDDSQDGDDSDESDDESAERDEETPKKAEPSNKRPAKSATKTPVQSKKAKATPQKTDGKKPGGGHVATPHPAKQAAKKMPANKPNQLTPKSGVSVHSCTSCNRTFTSEKGLESHTKVKHGGGK